MGWKLLVLSMGATGDDLSLLLTSVVTPVSNQESSPSRDFAVGQQLTLHLTTPQLSTLGTTANSNDDKEMTRQ